jgi:hypothetical protein
LEEDIQKHSTDNFNNIFGSVKIKTPVGFLGLLNYRTTRSGTEAEGVERAPAPYWLHNNGVLLQSSLKFSTINEVFLV